MTTKIDESALITLEKQMSPLTKRATSFTISTQEEQNSAGELLTALNRYSDQINSMKKDATDPLNKSLKTIRGWFKPREENVSEAIDALRSAMGAYQLAADKKAAEEAAKIAARVEKGTLKPETAVRKMDDIDAPSASIDTQGGGSVKFRTDYELIIDSHTELVLWLVKESQFAAFEISESAVKTLIKNGSVVAGAHIEEKRTVVNSR